MTDDPILELIDSSPVAESLKAELRKEWAHRQALAAGAAVLIHGYCPACGGGTLFVGAGGHVTCSFVECREPDAADLVLSDAETEHILEIGPKGFIARHPLIERVDERLMECSLAAHLAGLPGPPVRPGRYRVRPNDDSDPEPWYYELLDGGGDTS